MVEQRADEEQWTWRKAVLLAEQRLAERGLTRFQQPQHEYRDLGEVEKIERVGAEALANMMTRHLAWYSYAMVELAYAKAGLHVLDEIYSVQLAEEMNALSKTQDTRILKDVLKGMAINQSEPLKRAVRRRMERQSEVELLEGTVKGLEIRCRALEAEQIRRHSARKVEVGT